MSNPNKVTQTLAVQLNMACSMSIYDSSTNVVYVGGFVVNNPGPNGESVVL
jgi:hypothetical protein